jgi:phage antirepressor YoqD-like protein
MSMQLIPVPFRGTTLFVTDLDGQPFAPMKPIVEGMGLGWSGQHEKLNANKERWGIRVIRIPSEGGIQDAMCLPLRKLPGWLMTIQPTRVKPEIKDTIIAYQNECDEVLWQYWNEGQAENPRFKVPQSMADALQLAADYARRLEITEPKAEYYDRLMGSFDVITMEAAAKTLRTSRIKLMALLRNRGILTQSNLPAQTYIDRDYMRVVMTPYEDDFGRQRISEKTVLTQIGLEYVRTLVDSLELQRKQAMKKEAA